MKWLLLSPALALSIVVGTAVQSTPIVNYAKNTLGLGEELVSEHKPCEVFAEESPLASKALALQGGQIQVLRSIQSRLSENEAASAELITPAPTATHTNYSIYFGRIFVTAIPEDCSSANA